MNLFFFSSLFFLSIKSLAASVAEGTKVWHKMYLLTLRINQTNSAPSFPVSITGNTSTSLWGMTPDASARSKPRGTGLPKSWKGQALSCTEKDGCGWLTPNWKTPNSCHIGYQTMTHCSMDCAGHGLCFSPRSCPAVTLNTEQSLHGWECATFTLLHWYGWWGQGQSNCDDPPDGQPKTRCCYLPFLFSISHMLLTSAKRKQTWSKNQWSR